MEPTPTHNQTHRLARHLLTTRGPEILILQAPPIFGLLLAGFRLEPTHITRSLLLLTSSLALTTHIFLLNDWAGHPDDLRDPRRTANVYSRHRIPRPHITRTLLLLLLLALATIAPLGPQPLLLTAALATISYAYSCTPHLGKRTPILGSLNHLLGGTLHYLLGHATLHPETLTQALPLSLFFGLIFTAGHLNQEIRDHTSDKQNAIRTNAVAYGPRPTYIASLATFLTAYTLLATIAHRQHQPILLLATLTAALIHLALATRPHRHGLTYETARWLQHRYRILLALLGLTLLATLR